MYENYISGRLASRLHSSVRLLRSAFAAPAHKFLSIYPHRATLRFAIGLSHHIISRVLLCIVLKNIESGGPLPLTFHILQGDLAGRRDFTCFLPFGKHAQPLPGKSALLVGDRKVPFKAAVNLDTEAAHFSTHGDHSLGAGGRSGNRDLSGAFIGSITESWMRDAIASGRRRSAASELDLGDLKLRFRAADRGRNFHGDIARRYGERNINRNIQPFWLARIRADFEGRHAELDLRSDQIFPREPKNVIRTCRDGV